jgi:hypothetical protein
MLSFSIFYCKKRQKFTLEKLSFIDKQAVCYLQIRNLEKDLSELYWFLQYKRSSKLFDIISPHKAEKIIKILYSIIVVR